MICVCTQNGARPFYHKNNTFDIKHATTIKHIGLIRQYVKMKRESSILGKVVQVNPFFACCNFSPTYNVHMKGKTVSRIRWQRGSGVKSCMFSDDFQVYSSVPHRKGLVGSISRQTKAICLEDYSQADTYALSFQDVQMDRIQKTLLVAAVIMLVSLFLSLISLSLST